MLVYRDAARPVASGELRRELLSRVARTEANPAARESGERRELGALVLMAAELETALEDLASVAPTSVASATLSTARAFTDACADAWWQGAGWDRAGWSRALASLVLPAALRLKRAEGYAYYALEPGAYARGAIEVAARSGRVLLIGVRSIGTSLSAAAGAGLRARGVEVERLSVRPSGHAWDRQCTFDERELERRRASTTECLIVDEGPGLSGSTFLAVGEALERAGVARERITFLTSHAVDATRLLARDAARRWARFRSRAVDDRPPFIDAVDLGAGRWRQLVYAREAEWPSSWTSIERRKFRLQGGTDLLKFVGLPPYGEAPLARAERLGRAGFCPPLAPERAGYARQRWSEGALLSRGQLELARPTLVPRLVEYLAFRCEACRAPEQRLCALEEMTRVNVAEALGAALPASFRLDARRWVFPDARLAPHEWVRCADGAWLKLDAIDHGDDHFFPGPCDSAWDLAGAIIELELPDPEGFLDRYRRRTGDDAAPRLGPYLIAYAACRVGAVSMAQLSADPAEHERLERDRCRYRARLAALVARWRWEA